MKNEIRLALCQKISEKFGRTPQEHDDFVVLSTKIDLCESTLKRLFGVKAHDDCKDHLKRHESQQKMIKFLGYEFSWDVLKCELEFITNPQKTAQELVNLRMRKK